MVERFPSAPRGSSVLYSHAWLIGLIGLIIMIGSGLTYFLSRHWTVLAQVGLVVGGMLLLGAVLLRPDVVRSVLAGRPVKYASNAMLMSLAFIGILILINFLAVKYNWEYDATENGQFTFSAQTIQLLQSLDRPVQVIGFFQKGDPRRVLAEDYLERCSLYTEQLSYEFHDPNVEPGLARSYDLDDYGLLFISGPHIIETARVDEQGIINGLVRAISDREKQVFFLTGHGQPELTDSDADGYSKIRETLEQENYKVETLNLSSVKTMPSTSAVLMLAGLEKQLSDTERERLSQWATQGGKLMILTDPLKPAPLPELLARYGLSVENSLVSDEDNYLVGLAPTSPLIVQYPYHEITSELNGHLTFFPLARSLRLTESQIGAVWSNAPLLTTGPNSWVETTPEQPLEYNEGVDPTGPAHIGAVVEDSESGTRLVVLGSASFISNQHLLDEVANRDLFMNAINWLTEDETLISIRPKEPTNRRLFLTPFQHTFTILTSLILLPLMVIVVGTVIWWKRR